MAIPATSPAGHDYSVMSWLVASPFTPAHASWLDEAEILNNASATIT